MQIDSLELQISTNAETAANNLQHLKSVLKSIKGSAADYTKELTDLNKKLKAVAESSSAMQKVNSALAEAKGGEEEVTASAADATETIKENTEAVKENVKTTNKAVKSHKSLFAQLKRIATYRALRWALKEISTGIKEGVSDLEAWSRTYEGTFAASMDSMRADIKYIRDSSGAFLGGFLNDLAPLLTMLAERFAQATESASRFFAVIFGRDYYYKAVRGTKEYASAVGELKNQLLGFDELNVLNAPSGSSSSFGGGLFEKVALEDTAFPVLQSLILKIKGLDADFTISKGDAAKAIAKSVTSLAGGLLGFSLGGAPGAIIGTLAGATLGTIFSKLIPDIKGDADPGNIARVLATAFGIMLGSFVGFKFGGQGALVGATIGALLGLKITKLVPNLDPKADKGNVSDVLSSVLVALLGGYKGFQIANFKGGLLGAGIGLALSLGISALRTFKETGFDPNAPEFWDAVSKAIAGLGTALGFGLAFINPIAGVAALGISFVLSMELKDINWKNKTNKNSILYSLKQMWNDICTTYGLDRFKFDLKDVAYESVNAVYNEAYTPNKNKNVVSNKTFDANMFASGGTPNVGSLFWAGENGAELIAQVGGRTTVFNESQIAGELSVANEGVIATLTSVGNAIVSAINKKQTGINANDVRKAINQANMRYGV